MGNTTSQLKEILENAPKPISMEILNQLSQSLPKSLCFIDGKTVIGTGALYKLDEISKYRYIITCFHVLSPEYLFEAKFRFEGCEPFKIQPEWIGRQSFKPVGQGDYIAIELKQAAVTFLEEKGLKFLKVNSAEVDDQIVVIGYADADLTNPKLCFGHGAIQAKSAFTLEYYAAAGPGTSGSPVVLLTGEAISIHRARESDTPKAVLDVAGPRRFSTSLAEIKKNLLGILYFSDLLSVTKHTIFNG